MIKKNILNNDKTSSNVDILILGGGMVGLSLAYQISKKYSDLSVQVLEKENEIGLHNSGRNSGVLHAGIYYEPGSLKAKVCVDGAKRLKNWCINEEINVLQCGKLIVAQNPNQNKQLELLFDRGKKNGAKVEFINKNDLKEISPYIYSATDNIIWSPNTSVVNPKSVLKKLYKRLIEMGVKISCDSNIININQNSKSLKLIKKGISKTISYEHLFNCCGVYADQIAKKFGICEDYKILPFKGIYWQLKSNKAFSFKTNIYPVPDLNLPFLGVHITPNTKGDIFLGPTAVPAFGKENYQGLKGFDPLLTTSFLGNLSRQWLQNSNGFRRYALEQAFLGLKPFFLQAARSLVPSLKSEDLIPSKKVGIRAQVFDIKKNKLVQDFKLVNANNSTHVLNAISPAFTAIFALADVIINESKIFD